MTKKILNTQEILKITKEKRDNYIVDFVACLCGFVLFGCLMFLNFLIPTISGELYTFFNIFFIFSTFTCFCVCLSKANNILVFSKITQDIYKGRYNLEKDFVHRIYIKNGTMYADLQSFNSVVVHDKNVYNQLNFGSVCYHLKGSFNYEPVFFACEYELAKELEKKVCQYTFDHKAIEKILS